MHSIACTACQLHRALLSGKDAKAHATSSKAAKNKNRLPRSKAFSTTNPFNSLGTLRYPRRGGEENVGLPEKAWREDAATLVGKTN